jgi:hypothetical protein
MSDHPKQSLYGESNGQGDEQIKPLNLLDQISGVFSEPVKLFKRLSKRPQWIGAMALLTVLAVIFAVAWAIRVDAVSYLAMQFERVQIPLSTSQIDQAIETQAKLLLPLTAIGGLFGTPISIFFSGLIFWAIGMISRGEPQWKPTYCHGLVVAAIPMLATVPYTLLGTLMVFLGQVGTLRPDQLAPSSLGYWMYSDNPKFSALFSQLDLFLIFQYVVIYFAAKYALRTKTWGAYLCVVLVLLRPCISILFAK